MSVEGILLGLGLALNVGLFIWGVFYLAKAIRDNNKNNFL